MTSAIQSVQVAFTEWLAKFIGNPTFAAQAVGDIPGSLAADGITEDQLPYLNVQQAVSDACNYPGVPPAAKAALQPVAHSAPPPPPQTYTEVVQQLQVVNNYVHNEVIDNSTHTTIGDDFSGELVIDNDVTQVDGNENVVGDNNETANIDIDAGGGDGGPATGGAGGTATGGTATTTSSADGGAGGAGGAGGDGPGTGGAGTGGPGGSGGDGPGGDGTGGYGSGFGGTGGTGGAGGAGGTSTSGNADADADAEGGDATSTGGTGGNVGPINIQFGNDQQEAGPGDQTFFPPEQQTFYRTTEDTTPEDEGAGV
jgi:hypothetical protein